MVGVGVRLKAAFNGSFSSIIADRRRSAMTVIGIALGVGSLVASIGLAQSTRNAVNLELIQRAGRFMTVQQPGGLPWGIDEDSVNRLADHRSVVEAGLIADTTGAADVLGPLQFASPAEPPASVSLIGVSNTVLNMIGSDTPQFLPGLRTAFVGEGAAQRLGISSLANAPVVEIGGVLFHIRGFVEASDANVLTVANAVLVDVDYALRVLEVAASPVVVVQTTLGLTQEAQDVAPRMLDPNGDIGLSAVAQPQGIALQTTLDTDLRMLTIVLGAALVVAGGLAIANVMTIRVFARVGEIGLRRALGATRWQIALQFVTEGIVLAALGSLMGLAAGVTVSAVVAVSNQWPYFQPAEFVYVAPLLGIGIGLVASLYPAWRAARLSPVSALSGPH